MVVITAEEKSKLDNQALNNFQEYLGIPSVHPNIDYEPCVKFLKVQAKYLGLPVKVVQITESKPLVVVTWLGTNPLLPSIALSSHMDVVPVYEEKWTQKPFGANIVDGKVYARGAQDMKCVAIQYFEAIRRMKLKNIKLLRTLNLIFTPDEEIGGVDGMKKFVQTQEFKNLNVGFALDEGMASENDDFDVFYGERCIWQMQIHCPGTPGHGSLLLDNTAGEKVSHVLNKIFEFRLQEKLKLENNPDFTIGDVTTINLTKLQGGVQNNVVPPELTFTIDCRIPVTVDVVQWEATVNQWCREAGSDVFMEFCQKQPQIAPTRIDASNPYWVAFKQAASKIGVKLRTKIFPGGTDSKHLRGIGIPVLGFSPINNTPILLHDNDEFLGVNTFLKGIDIYMELIGAVANVPEK
ncbi:unnamed protein product [Brassicogethes aeneus]|uniref:N-acyl-aliphatic-L-amino acid amidohydrolase n=1 Tax=Brassicogethes aeneus TaxID=1431903 RepID=A0A9P0B5E4_BRAAE|nr:unnamed protein product [Brassicogethes aeneus]